MEEILRKQLEPTLLDMQKNFGSRDPPKIGIFIFRQISENMMNTKKKIYTCAIIE